MATSDSAQSSRGKRNSDDADSAPSSKRHETFGSDIRIIPLSSNLSGLSLNEPANFVACIIPKSLVNVFEKVLRETIERGLVTLHANTGNPPEEIESESELQGSDFIHDFESVKELYTKKLRELSDRDLKQEVPRGKFSIFKDYRRSLTKWFVTGQNLVKNLTSPSDSRKLLKIRTSFSPAVSNESTKQAVRLKLKTTSDQCETLLMGSVTQSAFNLNKETLDLFKNAEESSDTCLVKVLMKAFRSISKKYNYLTRPDNTTTNDDDNHERRLPLRPPRHQRTFYRRQPQRIDRFYRRESDTDNHSRYPHRKYDTYDYPDRDYRRLRRDNETDRIAERNYQHYNEDYPPMTNPNTNYRRYKRDPYYQERDYESDDVFEYDEQPQYKYRRSSRN